MSMQTQPQFHKVSINFSEELERDILGICLLEPYTAVKVAQSVHEDWFYYDFHKTMFKIIRNRIANFKSIDANTITEDLVIELQSREYQGEKITYLVCKCFKDVVSGAHISEWCEILQNLHTARQFEGIYSLSNSNIPTDQKKAKIEAILNSSQIVKNKTSWVAMGKVIEDYLNFYSDNQGRNVVGYQIGLPKLDWIIGGFRKETFTIIGARPSIGKSAFGNQAILKMASDGLKVGVVSIEMGNNELISRMLANVSGINFTDIYRLKVPLDEIQRQSSKLQDMNIFFSDQTKCSIEGIRASIVQLIGDNALDVVVIDYLQLMNAEEKTNTKNDEMGKITSGLKELTRRLKIPIIALAQLNRAGSGEPMLEHLRDSGNIEQDADVVMFIHGDRELEDRNIIIAKNRNGKLGKVQTRFIGENMRFEEVENHIEQISAPTF